MTAVLVAAVLATGPVTMEPRPLPPVEILISRCVEHPTCQVIEPPPASPPPVSPGEVATPAADPPPPSTPTANPPPPAGSGVERWRGLVGQFFPADQVDTALRILDCESGGDPRAYNPSGAAGLMQIHWPSWGDHYGVTVEDLFAPATNLAIAADIWAQLGWSQWACA